MDRRKFLKRSAGLAAVSAFAPHLVGCAEAKTDQVRSFALEAKPGRVPLVGVDGLETNVWAYNDGLPGPEIRLKQGERVRIALTNSLAEPTTLHCHGLRMPNAMDGVPKITQDPVQPGETFVYEFDCQDAGTFWYHPHFRSAQQLDRGLSGAFIVEEKEPLPVDREVVWVLDDWRLNDDASFSEDFDNGHDLTHGGRYGNFISINGRAPDPLIVTPGERIRFRLINVANARSFALYFENLKPVVIATDGHPVDPTSSDAGVFMLAPGQRADVVMDMSGKAGDVVRVGEVSDRQSAFVMTEIKYDGKDAVKGLAGTEIARLPDNPVVAPDLATAERVRIELGGGAMDPKLRRGDITVADLRARFQEGAIWTINDTARLTDLSTPVAALEKGRTYIFEMVNDTSFLHPMHIHGHTFQVVERDGTPLQTPHFQDTVLVPAGSSVSCAFVADNPGDWMFHCHILEHQVSGMMGVVRVA